MGTAELGHLIFSSIHAVAAIVALAAGILTLWQGRGFRIHQVGVIAMTALLAPSMSFGWTGFATAEKIVFCGLFGLAVFMIIQSFRADRIRNRETRAHRVLPSSRLGPDFVHACGFNVIALVVAGTVVPALRFGGPVAMGVSVVVAVVTAHLLVERRRGQVRRLIAERSAPEPALRSARDSERGSARPRSGSPSGSVRHPG